MSQSRSLCLTEKLTMGSLKLEKIVRLLKLSSSLIALTLVILSMVFYFSITHYNRMHRLQIHADHLADALSQFVFAYPDTWAYQSHRLEEIVARTIPRKYPLHVHLLSASNETLLEQSMEHFEPSTEHSGFYWEVRSDVTDGFDKVGTVVVADNMIETIRTSIIVLFVNMLIAAVMLFFLRGLLLRAISAALNKAEQTHGELKQVAASRARDLAKVSHTARILEKSAEGDSLTGLLNRHAFFHKLAQVVASRPEQQTEFVLIMADLDGFKKVNDTLGHQRGDDVLQQIASVIRSTVRSTDLVARYGGDEFILCLFSVDLQQALTVASKLCLQVRDLGEQILPEEIEVGISLGLSCSPEHHQDLKQLMGFADEAMYQAKQAGLCYAVYKDNNETVELIMP